MPRRLVAAFADIRELSRRDPSSFVCAFALWSLLSGFSLITTADPFHRSPIYGVIAEFHIDKDIVGVSMLVDGLLLLYSVVARKAMMRAGIAYISGICWFIWGVLLGISAWNSDLVSAAAIWIVISSFWLMGSITQHQPGAAAPRDLLHPPSNGDL